MAFGFGTPVPSAGPPPDDMVQQLLNAAAQKRQDAEDYAQQASQNYSSALATPPTPLSLPMTALQLGLSRVGSTLARQDLSTPTKALLEKRRAEHAALREQNLTALRQTYQAAAQRAQALGDQEGALKAHVAIKKLDDERQKAHDDAVAARYADEGKQRDAAAMERAKYTQGQENYRAGLKQSASGTGGGAGGEPIDYSPGVRTAQDSQGATLQYLDPSMFPIKQRGAIISQAGKDNMPVVSTKEATSISEIAQGLGTIGDMYDQIKDSLPKTWKDRATVGPLNHAAAMSHQNPALASYDSWRTAAIGIIPALVSRGIRITKQEIATLQSNLPTIDDDLPTAERKKAAFQVTLDRALYRTMGRTLMQIGSKRVGVAPADIEGMKKHGARIL